ncbi:hypothetical protein RDWZM_009449 [Blomia tropicalis]|uniref:Uncharacterized protein n=1 Tax=Blomia tropicalis TaxID=40697 RepID=A0A9Q0M5A7_BLOTA|nr:hypothetical protein RDWZM_009449 [Blomia tropicalis]
MSDLALSNPESHLYDYLKEEVSIRLTDRIFDIKRHFPTIVDLGCYKGQIADNLTDETVDRIICCSSSPNSLDKIEERRDLKIEKLLIDDEENFKLEANSVDLVISNLYLHWVNDLPKLFGNIISTLKEDGVFIGSMFGGQTLFELRCSLQMAEMEREGGFGLHVSPFITPQDIGGLLNRAGFTLLTIDADEIVVRYPSMFELMYDLKGMAENNALIRGRTHMNRDSLLAAAAIYNSIYGSDGSPKSEAVATNKPDGIPATFQIFYFIGWKPHPSQPKPLKPGSANFSLKDLAHLGKGNVNIKNE